MNLKKITPIDLYKIREVLEESDSFLKEENLSSAEDFTNKLFLEEVPGDILYLSLEDEKKLIGFIKLSQNFPLPGYCHLRLLVVKEKDFKKGYGAKAISLLKQKIKGTLWIDLSKDSASLKFWQKLGFKEEAGRWSLS